MKSATQEFSYTEAQVKVWLRGLMTIAWADGNFDEEEKALIHSMIGSKFAPDICFETFEPIDPAELADVLKADPTAAENFLRMAVMVAIADGIYSATEDKALVAFCQALNLDTSVLQALQSTLYNLRSITEEVQPGTTRVDSDSTAAAMATATAPTSPLTPPSEKDSLDPLKSARDWLDQLAIEDPRLARFICRMVPPQCPFERDIKLFGKKIVRIPPMCKLNPLYEQLVGLRFRSLSYLVDECHEDVSEYF